MAPEALKDIRPAHVLIVNPIYIEEITRDVTGMGLSPTISAL